MKKYLVIGILFVFSMFIAVMENNVPVSIICLTCSIFFIHKYRKSKQGSISSNIKALPREIVPAQSLGYHNCTSEKIHSLSSIVNNFISLDFETTGLTPASDRIIEISAIYFDHQKPVDLFSTLVNPGIKIPSSATKINGITNQMIKNAPTESQAIELLTQFILSKQNFSGVFVAYNAKFDGLFLDAACLRCNNNYDFPFLDCLDFARLAFNGLRDYKLATVSNHIGLDTENSHRATQDAINCGLVFIRAYNDMKLQKERIKNSMDENDLELSYKIKNILKPLYPDVAISIKKEKSGYVNYYHNFRLFISVRSTKTLFYILMNNSYCRQNKIKASAPTANEEGFMRYDIKCDEDIFSISDYIIKEYRKTLISNASNLPSDYIDFFQNSIDI